MKKTITTAALCLGALALQAHALEPVMHISAENANMLLGDMDENVMIISADNASRLLGDDADMLNISYLNNLPATAAGQEDILHISPDAAEALLGDPE